MNGSKYFKTKTAKPYVKNRRDADNLIVSTHKASSLIVMTILHDKFGFGGKRLERFLECYSDLLDSYSKGYVSMQDLNDTLYEETGIKII